VAHGAADGAEHGLAVLNGLRRRIVVNALCGRSGRGEEAREHGEGHDVAGDGRAGTVEIGLIFRQRIVETRSRRIGAFGLEEFVGDAHFDVVGFASENLERFILGFPAETSDGAVIAAVIGMAGDAERGLGLSVRGHVSEDGGVGDIFDQARAESGRGNAEDQIVLALHLREVGLGHDAAGSVATAGNGEDIVHATVGHLGVDGTVGIYGVGEAGFAHRAIGGDEKGNLVRGAVIVADGGLRILTDERIGGGAGAGAADGGLRVTTGATVGIVSRAQAGAGFAGRVAADRIGLDEAREAVLKKLKLRRRKRGEWLTGVDATGAHAGIAGGGAAVVSGGGVGGVGVVAPLGVGNGRDRESAQGERERKSKALSGIHSILLLTSWRRVCSYTDLAGALPAWNLGVKWRGK